MTSEEGRELEPILVEKETPSRVSDKENKPKRVAKLTSRTFSSLKKKIREKKMARAYEKYNKKYQQMKRALIDAEENRKKEDVTDAELAVDYSIVASYDKKLAKMGAKLLKYEIKQAVAEMYKEGQGSIGKPIRVPRFILNKMRTIMAIHAKIKNKFEQRATVKKMTKATEEYIKNTFNNALFKEEGGLQPEINSDVIKNLGLKGNKHSDAQRVLGTLKGFISKDGKTPIFSFDSDEDELSNKPKSNSGTDLPPVEPTTTVAKEEPKINVDDLIKKLSERKPEEKVETGTSNDNPTNVIPVRSAPEKIDVAKEIKTDNPVVEETSIEPIDIFPKKVPTTDEVVVTNNGAGLNASMEKVNVKKPETITATQVSTPVALVVNLQDIEKLAARIDAAKSRVASLKEEREELVKQRDMLKEFITKMEETRTIERVADGMGRENEALKKEVAGLGSQAATLTAELRK